MGGFVLALVLGAVAFGVYWLWKKRQERDSLAMENANIFEYGVKLCASEEYIKSYNCAQLRSRWVRKIQAKGILTVTNQRVIFHTLGIKDDRDFIHDEVAIADVSGISIQSGMVSDSALNMVFPGLAALTGKPNKKIFALTIASKGGKEGIIDITPSNSKGTMVDMSADMEPTAIVVEMANEIGAIISDIQTLGDLGIQKWRQ